MELSFGAWEGRHWDHIPRSESDPWADDVVHRSPPGGETVTQLRQRVARAMADLAPLSMSMEQVVVVVTHAGPIRVALADDARLAAWQDPKTPPPELAFGGLNWMSAQADGAWELGAINV
jgi:alpha-ribazole phosphatase